MLTVPEASSRALPTARVRRRSLRARTIRLAWTLHTWIGVACGLVMLIISVTGGLVVIRREMDAWFERNAYVVTPGTTRVPLTALAQRAEQAAQTSGFRPTYFIFEPGDDRAVRVVLRDPQDITRIRYAHVNPYSGDVLAERRDTDFLTRWLIVLHYRLLLGDTGIVITTIVTFGFLVLTVTGLWIYRGVLSALWRHPLRWREGWRVAMSDLHKWVGVASLALNLIWGVTGAWLMVPRVIRMFDEPATKSFVPVADWEQMPAFEPMLAAARERLPSAQVQAISIPLGPKQPVVVSMLQRDAPLWAKAWTLAFDRATGELTRAVDPREASFGARARAAMIPLHYGTMGASWVKWVYFVFAWSAAVLAASGYTVWYLRLRKKSKVQR